MSWAWSYGSWIYNYLCNQCLTPLTWVQTRSCAVCSIQHYVIKFFSDLWQVGGFLRVLGFLHKWNWPPRYKILLKVVLNTINHNHHLYLSTRKIILHFSSQKNSKLSHPPLRRVDRIQLDQQRKMTVVCGIYMITSTLHCIMLVMFKFQKIIEMSWVFWKFHCLYMYFENYIFSQPFQI